MSRGNRTSIAESRAGGPIWPARQAGNRHEEHGRFRIQPPPPATRRTAKQGTTADEPQDSPLDHACRVEPEEQAPVALGGNGEGRFTATQVVAAKPVRIAASRRRPWRRRPGAEWNDHQGGVEFATAPSPRRRPAHPSRRARYASVTAVAKATGTRSQFRNPKRSRVGASAKKSARRPAIRPSAG
jgi:hypothetical protein